MLHSYPTFSSKVCRSTKDAAGAYNPIDIDRPTVVRDYNNGMGGTDLQDQKASYYRYEHRTTKWPHRIYTHFIMSCTVNAHILFNEARKGPDEKVSLVDFIWTLAHQLAGFIDDDDEKESEEEDVLSEPVVQKAKRSKTLARSSERLCKTHCPSVSKGVRGTCMGGCGARPRSTCVDCDVFLCITGTGENNCFWRYHNLPKL
jgi:hypothetical protein